MTEEVLETVPVNQMNDYAISKWVNELQIKNSALMHGTETVRVRLFNTYGPGEYYSPWRSVICLFSYRALTDQPYTVYTQHHRTNTYIDDCVNALSAICGDSKPGERERERESKGGGWGGRVYNIASSEYYDIKTLSDFVLSAAGKTDKLVEYRDHEPQTTRDKKVDNSKAVRELGLMTTVGIEEGIARYVAWVKQVYSL
jgi:dTDP-glucose 4,6-dehydratase